MTATTEIEKTEVEPQQLRIEQQPARAGAQAENRTKDALSPAISHELHKNREPKPSADKASTQMESFVRGQVNALLKRTHAQAEADVQQTGQEQDADKAVKNVGSDDERDKGATLNR